MTEDPIKKNFRTLTHWLRQHRNYSLESYLNWAIVIAVASLLMLENTGIQNVSS